MIKLITVIVSMEPGYLVAWCAGVLIVGSVCVSVFGLAVRGVLWMYDVVSKWWGWGYGR